MLLDAGTDQSILDREGWTAKEHAVFRGHLKLSRRFAEGTPTGTLSALPQLQPSPETTIELPVGGWEPTRTVQISRAKGRSSDPALRWVRSQYTTERTNMHNRQPPKGGPQNVIISRIELRRVTNIENTFKEAK